jgi:probable HAF family extracellular repeat protein
MFSSLGSFRMQRPTRSVSLALLTTLFMPLQLFAHPPAVHHHYQLVDIGTFGGLGSAFVPGSGDSFSGSSVLTSGGTAVGYADTSMPDPFAPNFCFSQYDCAVVHTFQAGRSGQLRDLGALPGGSSSPLWISANGLIAGVSENGETDPLYTGLPQSRAVLWQHGKIKDLGTLPEGGYESEANAVNSAGQVVGSVLNTVPDANSMAVANYWFFNLPYGYQQRAFLWDEQRGMRDLGTLSGGTDAQAILINEEGQVVGWSYVGSAPTSACAPLRVATGSFIWEEGKGMRNLGGLGGTCTLAAYLNSHGQVVGQSNLTGDQSTHAFLWEHGSMKDLGGSLGGDFTGAFTLNERGQAAGFAFLAGDATFHGALWSHGGALTDLGVLGSDICSYASAINAGGQVVGGSSSDCDKVWRAFLWQDGGPLVELNTLVSSGAALYLQKTYAINDAGEIAGIGMDVNGNEHAFLLVPCDENHPDIEGCDYDPVDATATSEVRPVQVAQAPALSRLSPTALMTRIHSMMAGRYRKLGPSQPQ